MKVEDRMTQVGEGVSVGLSKETKAKFILASIVEVWLESGIEIYQVDAAETATLLPPSGTPHWSRSKGSHPSVYVREGGAGETKKLKVKVSWVQQGCDGSARLEGTSPDVKIAGDFSVSGPNGAATVDCEFTQRPTLVTNYGRGIQVAWGVTVAGECVAVSGGTPLKLYFVDQKPLLIDWKTKKRKPDGTFEEVEENKSFYLPIVEWATRWAQATQGSTNVLAALWDRFSDGKAARVPHVTGFEYWKTPMTP